MLDFLFYFFKLLILELKLITDWGWKALTTRSVLIGQLLALLSRFMKMNFRNRLVSFSKVFYATPETKRFSSFMISGGMQRGLLQGLKRGVGVAMRRSVVLEDVICLFLWSLCFGMEFTLKKNVSVQRA